MADANARYFLESIGSVPDDEWERRIHGVAPVVSNQDFYIGFANSFQFLEEVFIALEDLQSWFPLEEDQKGAWWDEVFAFEMRSRRIYSRRYTLSLQQSKVVARYFELAGKIVAEIRQLGPQWLDLRESVLTRLFDVLGPWSEDEHLLLQSLYTRYAELTGQELYSLRNAALERSQRQDLNPQQQVPVNPQQQVPEEPKTEPKRKINLQG